MGPGAHVPARKCNECVSRRQNYKKETVVFPLHALRSLRVCHHAGACARAKPPRALRWPAAEARAAHRSLLTRLSQRHNNVIPNQHFKKQWDVRACSSCERDAALQKGRPRWQPAQPAPPFHRRACAPGSASLRGKSAAVRVRPARGVRRPTNPNPPTLAGRPQPARRRPRPSSRAPPPALSARWCTRRRSATTPRSGRAGASLWLS